MDPQLFRTLRDTLVDLYKDTKKIRRVVGDAGLDAGSIDFNGSADDVWHEVLSEAEKHHKVEEVLHVVLREYPNNRPFRAAYAAYQGAQQSDSQVRRWWPALLIILGVVGMGSGIWYWRTYPVPEPTGERPQVAAALTPIAPHTSTATVPPATPTAVTAVVSTSTATVPAATPTVATTVASTATATVPAATPTAVATVVPSPAAARVTITPTVAILATATTLPVAPTTAGALCVFAFLVLDEQSEAPIKGANLTVIVGVRQETGVSDSTGYFLAQLPCADAQQVAARVRVRAATYVPYNRSVNLTGALTEIYLASTGDAPVADPSPATVAPSATPTTAVAAASSGDLRILDEGLTTDTYLLEGAAITQFTVGADLVVYTEANPGVEVAIALLKVIGQSPTSLTAQAILVDPEHPIRTRMRVDGNLDFLSTSQLVPVFDYAAGYLFRTSRVRLRPDHALAVGDQLQALEFERIDGEIIDALRTETIMEITNLGVDGQIAAVELLTGTWPVTGTIVALADVTAPLPSPTATDKPTATAQPEPTATPTPIATNQVRIVVTGIGAAPPDVTSPGLKKQYALTAAKAVASANFARWQNGEAVEEVTMSDQSTGELLEDAIRIEVQRARIPGGRVIEETYDDANGEAEVTVEYVVDLPQ